MRYRLLCVNAVVLIALMGSLWGRHIESATVAHPDFLRPLSLPFHDWKPRDVEITKHDLDLLEPDATLVRRYDGGGKGGPGLWALVVIRRRPLHRPISSMPANGG